MGNYMSCSFISPAMKNTKAARVILPGGEIRQFREPIKAAELMLECPAFFLVSSRSLNIGRRFSPLAADEDLEFGNLYIMFPMRRVNSVATAADMAVFFMAANSAAKRISGGKLRILSDAGDVLQKMGSTTGTATVDGSPENEIGSSRLDLEGSEGFPTPEFEYKLSVCRSRKPMLETITEEPLWSR